MYTINTPYRYEMHLGLVINTNRRAARAKAQGHGYTEKLDGFRRKFYLDGVFVGSVNVYPSNNGKFYAVSKYKYHLGEHMGLFKTFHEALEFAAE